MVLKIKPLNIKAVFNKVADVVKTIPPPPPPAKIIQKVENVIKSIPKPAPKPSTNLPSAPVAAVAAGAATGAMVGAAVTGAKTESTDQAPVSETDQTVTDQPPPAATAEFTPANPTVIDKIKFYFILINTTYPMWKKAVIYSGLAVCGLIILLIIGFLLHKLWKKFHPS